MNAQNPDFDSNSPAPLASNPAPVETCDESESARSERESARSENDCNNSDAARGENERLRAQIARLCREVPFGRVESYGGLGKRCEPPVSGYVCGRVMGQVMDGVPWWRIVGKDGRLPISKRSPNHSREQREKLELEGVRFADDGTIERRFFVGAGGEATASLFDVSYETQV